MSRWERLAMTIVVTVAIVVGVVTFALRSQAPETRSVTVLPGETLASIVMQELPDADFTRAAEVVANLNDLGGGAVAVGDVLRLPAG